MRSVFKRIARFSVVKPPEQPKPAEPTTLPQQKAQTELTEQTVNVEQLESLKQRWRKALSEYAQGRFSDKTVSLKGKLYYKHKVLGKTQSPNTFSESWIGLNEDMLPVLVTATYRYDIRGLLGVDVSEKVIDKDKAAEAGLSPEEVLTVLKAMESSTL